MIITHTSNPSLDYYMVVENDLKEGVQRAQSSYCLPGGKGLNVSMVLDQLKISSIATAFLGGETGSFIANQLSKYPYIHLDAVKIKEMNRINVKLRGKKEAEINALGPRIDENELKQMLEKCTDLNRSDWLVISGTLAQGVDKDFLIQISKIVHKKKARLVLDVAGIDYSLIQECQPYLIKPNVDELYEMFGLEFGEQSIEELANKLIMSNVENVLISMGKKGAEFYSKNVCYQISHPELMTINTVGAGDSMLAAFIGILDQGGSIYEALIWASAAGQATVLSQGLADYNKIVQMRDTVKIREKR